MWLAAGDTDMRKGFDGLARRRRRRCERDPFHGHLFVFRGRRGDLLKVLWWDGEGCACSPSGWSGVASSGRDGRGGALDAGAAAMLLEGIDWRQPAGLPAGAGRMTATD